mmetsp:Transcript_24677/g.70997  ORF Transcript_24677/g.70997 Transcript_24677/m.70997 type:complete len:583 (-) Transcript_24677:114-1862(-)
MGALAPLNLLVVIGANLPPEVLGEIRPREEEIKRKFQQVPDEVGEAVGVNDSEELLNGSYAWGGSAGSGDAGLGAAKRKAQGGGEPWDRGQLAGGLPGGDPGGGEVGQGSTFGLFTEHGTPTGTIGQRRRGILKGMKEEICMRACPGMVMVPQSVLTLEMKPGDEERFRRQQAEAGKVVLVMSRDNIAALAVIGSLSILGAIYLWKICTRRHCSCRLCRNQYRTLHMLGAGGYGSVYLVERLSDGARFVSKKILVREITEVDEYSREAKELVTLRHRHIVSYEEDFVHLEYGGLEPKTYFIIVMEYCPEGDLKEKIELDFGEFTEEWVRTVFAQLLQAVQYLHSKNVIHRDLKSQNVFLAHDGRVRLGDFGLCRHTRAVALGSATLTHAGTDCYMAPEMLSSSRYGKPADIWSLGCVLYELCTGQFMWELDGILGAMVIKDPHAVQKIVKANLTPGVGSALSSLMKRLLSVNPAARPTATACMRKKIFKRGCTLSRQPFGDFLEAGPEDTPPGATSCGPSTPPIGHESGCSSGEGEGEEEGEDSSSSDASESPAAVLRESSTNSEMAMRKRRSARRRRAGRR